MNGNINPELFKNAKNQNPEKLLEQLSEQDRKKVTDMLADKNALANLLKSPEALAIMNLLSGKGKNG